MRRDLQKRHTTTPDERKQSKAFLDAARTLECDESEARFDAALKKIAAHKPPKDRDGASEAKDKQTKEPR
jgi:hypothetical protein